MSRTTDGAGTSLISRWPLVQLGRVAHISTGTEDVQDADEGAYPFFVRSEEVRALTYFTHDTEAVLTAGDGNVGDIFHHFKGRFAAHQRVYILEPGKRLHARYLFYAMRSLFKESLQGNTAKSTVESLRRPMLTSFRLPFPPRSDQQAVADYLDHETAEIDAFIADLLRLTDLTSERTRSHVGYLMSEYSRIGSHFETSLGRVIRVSQGQVDPRLPSFAAWPLVAPNHIESMSGRLLELSSAKEQGAESGKYLVKPGQVVYSKIRPALMKATRVDFHALCSADMYAMDANPRWLNNDYLLEYLLSPEFETFAVTMSERVAMPKLNRDTLARAPIAIPHHTVQREIVATASAARLELLQIRTEAEAAIDLARERRAALISAAVTGQIDVTKRRKPVVEQLEDEVLERV